MTKIDTHKDHSTKYSDDCRQDGSNENGKKKKRRKRATICTTYCKFDIVRRTARTLGMKEVPYNETWNVLWTDYSVSIAKIKILKGYQRVNHFPGMAEICHKALLAKNLNRMAKSFPKQYGFFPKTWCFPSEYNDAVEYSKKHVGRTYILKPGAGCRGQGIQLTKNFRCLPPADKLICQLYISKPFLVDGLKFDLRVYTLITSCDPLRVYVYNEGLARFATAPYRKPAGYNLANCYMHLTNYSVNKYSSTFVSDGECGTKRRISCFNQWLSRNLYDVEEIWYKIDDVIVKTIVSGLPVIRHSYQVSFPNHDVLPACFEILGFDILLDNNLNPYVLEVNHSPSFNTDSKVDEEIKVALLEDTFRLLNLPEMDTQRIVEQDKKRSQMRLQHGIDPQDLDERFYPPDSYWCYEEVLTGNYRLVYPVKGKPIGSREDPYKQYIDHACNFSLLVADNTASKVREQVGKIQREQVSQKDHLEQLLKVHGNNVTNVKAAPNPIQQVNSKIPEIIVKNMKSDASKLRIQKKENSKVYEESRASLQIPPEKKIMSNNKLVSIRDKIDLSKSNISNKDYVLGKGDFIFDKSTSEKENSKVNNLRSEINLVILESEEQRKKENDLHKSSELIVQQLYSKLKESGHMPGAFTSTEPNQNPLIEDISPSVPVLSSAKEKLTSEKNTKHKSNRKHKYLEDPNVTERFSKASKKDEAKKDEAKKKEQSKWEDHMSRRRIPAKELALIFHSRAASEFLKFQKMKLLRKFQDLT